MINELIQTLAARYGVDDDELQEACAVYNTTLIPLLMAMAEELANAASHDEVMAEYIQSAEEMIDVHRGTSGIDFSDRHEQIAQRVVRYDTARKALKAAFAS